MIEIDLDVMLAIRKMTSQELAEKIGITPANLSILKTGKARAVRFSTLDALCKVLLKLEPCVLNLAIAYFINKSILDLDCRRGKEKY